MIVGTATEVYLDEVESALLEKEVSILLLVFVEAHTLACDIAIEHTATSVMACITVDTCLQAFLMDIVGYHLQPIGETGGVNQ